MEANLYLMVVVSTIIFLLLSIFIVGFLLLFQRRQLQNLREKTALKAAYEQEILQAQVEVQNQTLQQISRDLHDNIGQLLSLAKLHLNALEEETNPHLATGRLADVGAVIDLSIREVRALTKSLDKDFVQDFGLVSSLQHELNRLEQTGRFTTAFKLTGKTYPLGFQRDIILFRVVQEILNNAIKHAGADHINVSGLFLPNQLELCISDNGQGFDYAEAQTRPLATSGAGLRTIQRRTELLGGYCRIESTIGKGTRITLIVPATQQAV